MLTPLDAPYSTTDWYRLVAPAELGFSAGWTSASAASIERAKRWSSQIHSRSVPIMVSIVADDMTPDLPARGPFSGGVE